MRARAPAVEVVRTTVRRIGAQRLTSFFLLFAEARQANCKVIYYACTAKRNRIGGLTSEGVFPGAPAGVSSLFLGIAPRGLSLMIAVFSFELACVSCADILYVG